MTPRGAALAAFCASVALSTACWGFTVDDALITCRYAHQIALGNGYTFNPSQPPTDGVTPLGFAYLLAPFAGGSALTALYAAKLLGLLGHAVGAAFVAVAIQRMGGTRWRFAGLVAWLVSAPAMAWSVSGMETGLVSGLVAVGLSLRVMGLKEPLGVGLLGLAAGWRPELLPMVVTLGMPRVDGGMQTNDTGAAATQKNPIDWRSFGRLGIAIAPFILAAAARAIAFGRPGPLSALAKPADLKLGFDYAVVCSLVIGTVGVVAPLVLWRKASRFTRWMVVAVVAHTAAVIFAGGDWMPVSRLFVAMMPVLALAVGGLASVMEGPRVWMWVALRGALAVGGEAYVWYVTGEKLRRVQSDREALIAQMRSPLAESRVIAALDVGWLGEAAPEATIVDLAGVTDPEIAALPGGHMKKKIPDGLLASRKTDTIVFQLFKEYPVAEPWSESVFAHGIAMYIAKEPGLEDRFVPVFVSDGRVRYVVLRRRP